MWKHALVLGGASGLSGSLIRELDQKGTIIDVYGRTISGQL